MKKHFTLVFFGFLLFYFKPTLAQDLIVRKDGSKIYCSIVKVDSLSISYFKASQKNSSIISRAEVETFYRKSIGKNKYAQDSVKMKDELLIIQLGAGFANPIGVFADKDLAKETSGLASKGYLLQGTVILKLSRYFGFAGSYHYHKYTVANSVLQQAYSSMFLPSVTVKVSTTAWISQGFYGGIYLHAPVQSVKNLSVDFLVLGGLPKLKSPETKIEVSQGSISESLTQHVGETNALAFMGKMGLSYRINRAALHLNVGFFAVKPSFNNVLIESSSGSIDYAKFEQKMKSVNLEAGFSFLIFQ